MKKFLSAFVVLALLWLVCAYLFSPLRPFAWQPLRLKPTHIAEKSFLHVASIDLSPSIAHEDTAIDAEGFLYTGAQGLKTEKSSIYKITPKTYNVEKWLEIQEGSIAGLRFDSQNNLWACNPTQGLLKITLKDKKVEKVLSEVAGKRFALLNDLTISKDDTIYLTDSSIRSPFHIRHELIEAHPTGWLMSWSLKEGARVLIEDLFWPNGLLLSPEEDYLLVVEMGKYKIWKFWLKGERAGTKEIWLENLIGFPNGLSYSKKDSVLVGLIANRSVLLDKIHPFPSIKRIFGSIPEWLQPEQSSRGRLLEYSLEAKLLNVWADKGEGKVVEVSSAETWGDFYVLGSDRQTNLSVVKLEE